MGPGLPSSCHQGVIITGVLEAAAEGEQGGGRLAATTGTGHEHARLGDANGSGMKQGPTPSSDPPGKKPQQGRRLPVKR